MSGQQVKRVKRPISGVLLLDKPYGFSSNGALQKVKWLFQAEKAGHTGNLDPIATGLLPICLGEATKFSQVLLDADKAYLATLTLGQTTTTGDSEGAVLETCPVAVEEARVRDVLQALTGEIEQVPPMYSALKHEGRKLYEYARQGVEIERKARPVTIYGIELVRFAGDELVIDVACSKGTYIRVLAEEIGRRLGCGAHLIGLRRTRTAGFALQQAYPVEALEGMSLAERDSLLLPADCLLQHLPEVRLGGDAGHYFSRGQAVWHARMQEQGELRVYDDADNFLGLGMVDADGRVAPKRVLRIDR